MSSRYSRSLNRNPADDASPYSSRRAPDPTQRGKRGVSTVNVKHQAAIAKNKSMKIQDQSNSDSHSSRSSGAVLKLLSAGRSSDTLKRLVTKNAKKKRMKKANTNNIKNDDELSDGYDRKPRSKRSMSLKGTMPRRMKNLLNNFYKKKPVKISEADDEEIDLLNTEQELMNEASEGYTNKDKFKQAMLQKYGNGVGSYGFSMENMAIPKKRRDSSFGAERPMVLLLGRSRAGKSTIFKQLMTLSGAPPNYARAYRATKSPVEEDITIDEADMTLVDVGGSNEDIVDWRFYLTSAEVIVYVVALDEYDKVVPGKEGNEKTKPYTYLKESIELFDSIINNVALLNSKFVLILNKADRFKKKIEEKKISLRDTNAYDNAPLTNDYDESLEFIEDLFLERAETSEHEVEIEVTSAIDSEKCNDVLGRITQRLVRGKDVTKWKNLL